MEQWLELVKDSVCGLKFKTKLWTERQETTACCRELGEVAWGGGVGLCQAPGTENLPHIMAQTPYFLPSGPLFQLFSPLAQTGLTQCPASTPSISFA